MQEKTIYKQNGNNPSNFSIFTQHTTICTIFVNNNFAT